MLARGGLKPSGSNSAVSGLLASPPPPRSIKRIVNLPLPQQAQALPSANYRRPSNAPVQPANLDLAFENARSISFSGNGDISMRHAPIQQNVQNSARASRNPSSIHITPVPTPGFSHSNDLRHQRTMEQETSMRNVTRNQVFDRNNNRGSPDRSSPVRTSEGINLIDLSSPPPEEEEDIQEFTRPDTQAPGVQHGDFRRPSRNVEATRNLPTSHVSEVEAPFASCTGRVRQLHRPQSYPAQKAELGNGDNDDELYANLDVESIIAERTMQSRPPLPPLTSPVPVTPGCRSSMPSFSAVTAQSAASRPSGNRDEIARLKRRIVVVHDCLYNINSLLAMDMEDDTVARYTERKHLKQQELKELTEKLRLLEREGSISTPSTRLGPSNASNLYSPITPETTGLSRHSFAPGRNVLNADLNNFTTDQCQSRSAPSNSAASARQPSNGSNINITNNFFSPQPAIPSSDFVERSVGGQLPRHPSALHYSGASPSNPPHEARQQIPGEYHRPDNLPIDVEALIPQASDMDVPVDEPDVDPATIDDDRPVAFTPTKAPLQGTLREIQGSQYQMREEECTSSSQWKDGEGRHFPWSMQLAMENRTVFGNVGFRSNQREAMNAALSGKDVFILMPTGGGKSLCYQLPSLLSPGVSVVISPLVSLIQDQVDHLWSKQIPCGALTSGTPLKTRNELMKDLYNTSPMTKLIYVTPEKITRSPAFFDLLISLSKRKALQRFVIDEAHCVSQWGHDFRPDYKQLAVFKQRFPQVPIMALTATATPEVREDIKVQLRIGRDCVMFKQSFNRCNLTYEVRRKKKNVVDEIAMEIKTIHQGETGIVYCFSQKDCVNVAEILVSKHHLRALPYHAGLSDGIRRGNQLEWSKGGVQIICSTLAFGMGIDKADVRFVYHHSMPKTIEGYYQESGRAGRDGQISRCVLYFSMADKMKLLNMLLKDAPGGNPFATARDKRGRNRRPTSSGSRDTGSEMNEGQVLRNTQGLALITAYCLNDIVCRRTQLLAHFGEKFDFSQCEPKCDNCKNTKGVIYNNDVSDHGLAITDVVDLCQKTGRLSSGQSAAYVVEFYLGRKSRVKSQEHLTNKSFGGGKGVLKDNDVYRIIEELCSLQILHVSCDINAYGGVQSELFLNLDKGPLGKLRRGQTRITLQSRSKPTCAPNGTKKSKGANAVSRTPKRAHPESNIQEDVPEVQYMPPEVTYTSPYFQGLNGSPVANHPNSTRNALVGSPKKKRKQAASGAIVINEDDDYADMDCVERPLEVSKPSKPRAQSVKLPPAMRSRKRRGSNG